jgi:hypothetical protein
VRRKLAESVVDFLSFSGNPVDRLDALTGFHRRDWEQTLIWLHDAGLALYFLQELKNSNAAGILPRLILSRLEENLAANQRRVAFMARQFDFLNQEFNAAGVRYAAVKGFSLVPQFCPNASLRHQGDLDYLVDRQSLPLAQRVLQEVGYSLRKYSANELVYMTPSAGLPPPDDEQYDAHAPYAVELRLAFWDNEMHGVPLREPEFSVDNVRTHRWQGLVFRALPEEDVFLLQVIHAFNHILTGWVRVSWLYEIGYFLNQRSTDTLLWERIEHRIGRDPLLREIVVVVAELSVHLFQAPFPSTSTIRAEELRPAVRIWIQNYSRSWVFAKNQAAQISLFSVAKLILFLHQQFLPDASARRHLTRSRMLPWKQFSRRVGSLTAKSSTNVGGRRRQIKRVLIRLIFHGTSGLRYLWEIPRWRRLIKAAAHSTPSIKRDAANDLGGTRSPESTIPS